MTVRIAGRGVPLPNAVFLDACLIIDLVAESSMYHESADRLFRQFVRAAHIGRTQLYVSPLVLDEVWWSLVPVLYEQEHGEGSWRRDQPARKEALRSYGAELRSTTELVLRHPVVRVAAVVEDDVPVALQHVIDVARPHLRPRDAFHLAVMKRLGIGGIATRDPDFIGGPSLVVLSYARMH